MISIRTDFQLEAISKIGFRFKIKADPRFEPQSYREYVEDLNRGPNTEIGLEDIFEIASKNSDGVALE